MAKHDLRLHLKAGGSVPAYHYKAEREPTFKKDLRHFTKVWCCGFVIVVAIELLAVWLVP